MLTFYAEWLSLPKEQFRILAMLADKGEFQGNLSDMCRYFFVDPQTHHRNRLRAAIEALTRQGYIATQKTGRAYVMRAIPKAAEISIPAEWAECLRRHDYTVESVAWEVVLKVQLWLLQYSVGVITNDLIAIDLGVSTSTVVAAKNVLEREYHAFRKRYVSDKINDYFYIRKGQIIDMAAWWS